VPGILVAEWRRHRGDSLWQYAPLLPLAKAACAVSLGEGQTPLLRSEVFHRVHGCPNVFVKDETRNPTWCHKDRYHSVSVSMARSLGFARIAAASTGNHGVSAAAYASRAGLECIVFLAAETSPSMWYLAGLYGARVVVTSFDGREVLLAALAERPGWFVAGALGPDGRGDPFGIEGYKTIAFEIIRQVGGTPDSVFVPVGGGDLLYGVWKGFREAREVGMTTDVPRIVACQPLGANVAERAMRDGLAAPPTVDDAYSVATSTREKTTRADALRAIQESGGQAVSATEREILNAVRAAGREGLCLEPASALAMACLPRARDERLVAARDRVVCILTSAGIKWPELLPEVSRPPVRVLPSRAELNGLLAQEGGQNKSHGTPD
jgi:threonine synthase